MSATREPGRVVAVAGASGLLGLEILRVLQDDAFPVTELRPIASGVEEEAHVEFFDDEVPLRAPDADVFDGCDVVFLAGAPDQAAEMAKLAFNKARCIIDLSGRFGADEDVPLILSDVNGAEIEKLPARPLVAVPDAAAAIVAHALAPLRGLGIVRATVSTYEAASAMGRPGMDELGKQIKDLFNYRSTESTVFPRSLAFNVLPRVDSFEPSGYTRSEVALSRSVSRLLGGMTKVAATRAWVPVFSAHSASIALELAKPVSLAELRAAWEGNASVELRDDPAEDEFPVSGEAVGGDSVFVGRVRLDDPAGERSTRILLWVTADNLRQGSAIGAVRIAQAILARKAS